MDQLFIAKALNLRIKKITIKPKFLANMYIKLMTAIALNLLLAPNLYNDYMMKFYPHKYCQ